MFKFNPATIKAPTTLSHDRQFTVVRFSPDGTSLFSAGYDGRLYRWNLESKEKTSFEAHRGWVEAMALHPDRQRLFTADSWGQVHCWNVADENLKPLWSIEATCASWLRGLAISPDGKWLATCGNEPVVRVYSAADGKLAHQLKGHEQPVLSVVFTADSTGLANGDLHGVVRQWRLSDGECERQLDARSLFKTFHQYQQGGIRAMAFDDQGKVLYCAGFEGTNANQAQGNPAVVPIDWASGKTLATLVSSEPFNGPILDVAWHASGYILATGSSEGGGAIWFWKPGETKSIQRVKFQNSFRRLDLSADGKRLAIAAFGDLDGQRGGNGRRLNKAGEYVDFGGSIAIYDLDPPGTP